MNKLKKLSLNDIQIKLDHRIINLSNLESLQIELVETEDTTNYLQAFSKMKELYLKNYQGNLNTMIKSMPELKLLYLYTTNEENNITINDNIEGLNKLEVLTILFYKIDFNFKKLKNLKLIFLHQNKFENFNEYLKIINEISHLKKTKIVVIRELFNDLKFNEILSKNMKISFITKLRLHKVNSIFF